MSRTLRTISKGYKPQYLTIGGDAWVDTFNHQPKKLTPYSKDRGMQKFRTYKPEFAPPTVSITKAQKLMVKNANRSLKKGLRQQFKKEIRQELNYA